MVILDTNVISEMTRGAPEPHVVAWYMRQDSGSLFTTTVSFAEIQHGLNRLPRGRRRDQLSRFADEFFGQELAGKILSFDAVAAIQYGKIRAARRVLGFSMSPLDAQIAAIAAAAGASVATRNVDDFKHCGVAVVNPWIAEC